MLRYILSRYSAHFKGSININSKKIDKDIYHTPLGRWSINEPDNIKYIKADLATHDSCGGAQCNYPITHKKIEFIEKDVALTNALNERLAIYIGEGTYIK
tara:strand:+ start:96 stop:395 length:300 start_codon:yes stop_codon:yes gene_type:complete